VTRLLQALSVNVFLIVLTTFVGWSLGKANVGFLVGVWLVVFLERFNEVGRDLKKLLEATEEWTKIVKEARDRK
jgi:hypothetical protein